MRRNCIRFGYRLPSGAIISNRHSPLTRISIDFVSTLKPAGPNHWGRRRGSAQAAKTNSRGALTTRERTISRSSGAWPLGGRSAVRAEQYLHRDLGRASNALRDVGQGGRQGYPDGSHRTHQAGEEATKGAV